MTETVLQQMTDRRNPMRPARTVAVYSDRLEWLEEGVLIRRIALDQVRQVRLSVEVAGQQTQVVCRVMGPSGEIVFGSRRVVSPSVWEDNALAFQSVLVAVHESLRDRFDTVRFVEGQSLGFKLVMTAIGVVMSLAALVFSGFMMLIEDSAMLALAGLPFVVIGGYLAWVFRPGRPVPYDPDGLITRFTAAAD